MSLSVFLPCRSGSKRVVGKNTKPFAGFSFGLVELKLSQLSDVEEIDKIYVSTDDQTTIDFINQLNHTKINVVNRPFELAQDYTKTHHLCAHAAEICDTDHILWTHVTSPLIGSSLYSDAINTYYKKLLHGHDSLMSVSSIRKYCYYKGEKLNFGQEGNKWTATQDLEPLIEVNSGIFILSTIGYTTFNDRIGNNPYLFEIAAPYDMDVDWPIDFKMAEVAYKSLKHDR